MRKSFSSRRPLTLLALALVGLGAALLLMLGGSGDGSHARAQSSYEHSKSRQPPPCDRTLGSAEALRSQLAQADPGAVICLQDGSYGELKLASHGSGADVTVRAEHPGGASIAGADLSGSHLALADFDVHGQVTVEPGSRKISVLHNRISGGYFGVEAGPTDTTYISDTTIAGNKFVGPFGEDAIRLNRYHDSGDRDPYGVLIEGNEITGVRENGNHSDCLQSVWGGDGLYFRRNYLHDNRCQGFFVNDQPAPVRNVVVANNLMLRNAAPCDPPDSGCGPPSIVQMFGPIQGLRIARNTIWTKDNDSPLALREGPYGPIAIEDNVVYRFWSDWSGPWSPFRAQKNVFCRWEGTLPRPGKSSRRSCSPHFAAPAQDDYRVPGGAGVNWAPGAEHYGP
ncbi:MAG: hypothetical protein ACTHN3_08735 [Solirubrobacterales bacterium]